MKTEIISDYDHRQISSAFNVAKTEHILIASQQHVCIGRDPVKRVKYTKILGVHIDKSLTWSKHVEEISIRITA
ncbi:hypothetical protein pdam_00014681 [Pocillopora damicornis]|uniref:Uncharacterized protein n=1 Tax=Pocillopora damicornis TaxID=46731 RepID=A0A3M6U3K9_POCDA|nr:hypothetical protein pdam_00014681 [Pocillopora damicornis]